MTRTVSIVQRLQSFIILSFTVTIKSVGLLFNTFMQSKLGAFTNMLLTPNDSRKLVLGRVKCFNLLISFTEFVISCFDDIFVHSLCFYVIYVCMVIDADLCLKYYRALRYRMWCVMMWTKVHWLHKKWSSLFETTYVYEDFNGGYNSALVVRIQNCEWTI